MGLPERIIPRKFLTHDSPENALLVEDGIKGNFPKVKVKIIYKDFEEFTSVDVPTGQVLIHVVIPDVNKIDNVELMKVWHKSLNKNST